MTLLNFIAETGKFLGTGTILNCILAFGYLLISRDGFARIFICTILMGLLFNSFLKVLFGVDMGDMTGYATPSGHMQLYTVFWVCMLLEFRTKIVFFISLINIFLIAFYLIFFGYHSLHNVMCGALASIPGCLLYYYYKDNNSKTKVYSSLAMGLSFVLLTYLIGGYHYPTYSLFFLVIQISFTVFWLINKKTYHTRIINLRYYVTKLVLSVAIIYFMHIILDAFLEEYKLMTLYNLSLLNLLGNIIMVLTVSLATDAIFNRTLPKRL